jgi:putative transposase
MGATGQSPLQQYHTNRWVNNPDMPYNPEKHHRRSIRLREWDYSSPGAYFVTICTEQRVSLFGAVVDREMQLNTYGCIVETEWERSARIRQEIELDAFVVMPNHFHAVVHIVEVDRGDWPVAPTTPIAPPPVDPAMPVTPEHEPEFKPGPRPRSLSSLMVRFKGAVTKHINALRQNPGDKVWQRNYYERIIRNERHLQAVREYILNNPVNWEKDEYFLSDRW